MKIALFSVVLLAGCQTITPLEIEPRGSEDRFVYLVADTDPAATKCGGVFNDVILPDTPLQTTQPRCRLSVQAKNGNNSWIACNSNASSEACITTPFTFNLKGGKP